MSRPNRESRYVLDASVVVKLFVAEPLTDEARAFFAGVAQDGDARLFAPELLYAEVANVLWKYVRREEVSRGVAREGLRKLRELALEDVSVAVIIDDALVLAMDHGVSVYDACYVAAARLVDAPLITADEALVRALGDAHAAEILTLPQALGIGGG